MKRKKIKIVEGKRGVTGLSPGKRIPPKVWTNKKKRRKKGKCGGAGEGSPKLVKSQWRGRQKRNYKVTEK